MSDPSTLRRLVREAVEEPVPEIDWDRVEERLFARIEQEPIPLRSRRVAAWRPLVAIAAIAAGVAAATTSAFAPNDTSQTQSHQVAATQRQASGVLEASSLHPGERVTAKTGGLTVQHPNHATWVLAESSSVVVQQLGSVVVLDLESGTVRVEVVPRPEVESFVVRVGDTAVSVHGTIFSVERRADRAVVMVERGSVAVGPRSRNGQGQGWLMVAPAKAAFSLDGSHTATFQELPPPPIAAAPNPDQVLPTVSNPAPAPTHPQPARTAQLIAATPPTPPAELPTEVVADLPEQLTEALARSSLDSIRAQALQCYANRSQNAGTEGVKVTVRSTLTMTIGPEGRMTLGRFDPPLAPDVQSCAASAAFSTSFPRAKNPSTLTLPLQFSK